MQTQIDIPVDFYAGAIALFAVVIFAKFSTHYVSRQSKARKPPKPEADDWKSKLKKWGSYALCGSLWVLHWVCVLVAFGGLAVSLLILGHAPSVIEWDKGPDVPFPWGRQVVIWTAAISGGILALDVLIFAHIDAVKADEQVAAKGSGKATGK
jgi:hypothetical protein